MPLSTSSSSRPIPDKVLSQYLLVGLLTGFLLVGIAEAMVRLKGGIPDVTDKPELWSAQRQRATDLGERAITLVGASRIQLGISLNALKQATGKEPVQLAIDGSSFLEILEDLANDPDVKGPILISATLESLNSTNDNERPVKWLKFYHDKFRGLWQPSVEQLLTAKLQTVSALYANIVPLDLLPEILFTDLRLSLNYLRTYPSRERDADYSLVVMPDFYLNRVFLDLGKEPPLKKIHDWKKFNKSVIEIARNTKPVINTSPAQFQRIYNALSKLKKRGVKVSIIYFPASALIKAIDNIRYPKQLWDKVTARLPATIVDYRDYPELQYELADGAHLDKSQKIEFTQRLARILKRLDAL